MNREVGRVRLRLSLAAQILALQLAIVLLVVGVAAAVSIQKTRGDLERQEGARMLAIAESVAAMPSVREAFDDRDPARVLQPLALAMREASDVTFVVIANRDQVRYAHPDPTKIGQRLSTDASTALSGRAVVKTETGTLGRTVRAKVPVVDGSGEILGVVSVGMLEERLAAQLRDSLPQMFLSLLGALVLGGIGAVLLARRVKRQTLGLEPAAIGRLLEEREATLGGIREGVLVLDEDRRITFVNDEALRLLDIPAQSVGNVVSDIALSPRLRDVVEGEVAGDDEIVLRAGRVLVLNRKSVVVRGRPAGAVVTLRDRTELDALSTELDGARSTTDALRAQAHEFSNRLHTVAGLIELGRTDEALEFVHHVSMSHEEATARLTAQVGEAPVAALLLAKTASAAERGVELRLSPDTALAARTPVDVDALVTVIGNLVDNAVEALAGQRGWVDVALRALRDGVVVEVRDSGPGVAPELADEVFRDGFTTKIARSGGTRGLGLALTRQACVTRGGWVEVRNEGGAVFTALLPYESSVVR